MFIRLKVVAAALCAGVLVCSANAEAQTRQTVPPPTAQQIVLARQAALEMSAVTLGYLKSSHGPPLVN